MTDDDLFDTAKKGKDKKRADWGFDLLSRDLLQSDALKKKGVYVFGFDTVKADPKELAEVLARENYEQSNAKTSKLAAQQLKDVKSPVTVYQNILENTTFDQLPNPHNATVKGVRATFVIVDDKTKEAIATVTQIKYKLNGSDFTVTATNQFGQTEELRTLEVKKDGQIIKRATLERTADGGAVYKNSDVDFKDLRHKYTPQDLLDKATAQEKKNETERKIQEQKEERGKGAGNKEVKATTEHLDPKKLGQAVALAENKYGVPSASMPEDPNKPVALNTPTRSRDGAVIQQG